MKTEDIIALVALAGAAFALGLAVIQDGRLWIRVKQGKDPDGAGPMGEHDTWVTPAEPGREFGRDLSGRFIPFS